VNSIEHGTSLSDNTLKLMHERNVCFAPTLAASAMGVNPTSDSPDAVELAIRTCAMLPRARETTRHARQMGVNIMAGSDSGYTPDDPHRFSDAMVELVLTEMTPMEAIQPVTSRAEECLGYFKTHRSGSPWS